MPPFPSPGPRSNMGGQSFTNLYRQDPRARRQLALDRDAGGSVRRLRPRRAARSRPTARISPNGFEPTPVSPLGTPALFPVDRDLSRIGSVDRGAGVALGLYAHRSRPPRGTPPAADFARRQLSQYPGGPAGRASDRFGSGGAVLRDAPCYPGGSRVARHDRRRECRWCRNPWVALALSLGQISVMGSWS